MKRSNDSILATPHRRSLILHHQPPMNDLEVVAFLDNSAPPVFDTLSYKLVQANEPALLIELIWMTQGRALTLCVIDAANQVAPLHDGLLEYLLQHISMVPCLNKLTVQRAVLSAACCTLLQTALADPTCTLTSLTFSDCTFANEHVEFPRQAATIQALRWQETIVMPGAASPMNQMLSALAAWTPLKSVSLAVRESLLNFATITQLLVRNPHITDLSLASHMAPPSPDDGGYQSQHDPALLLDQLMNNQIQLTRLTLDVRDAHNAAFNQHFINHLGQCLMSNVTLEALCVPGIRMYMEEDLTPLTIGLDSNHGLISMAPLGPFGNQMPAPVRRNQRQRYWFSQEFVQGAAEAFLLSLRVPAELGKKLAQYVASTPAERALGGAVMTLICKSTYQGAVKLRSAALREAALNCMRTNNQVSCLELLNTLLLHHADLLPEDKQAVIAYAKDFNRLNFLPSGYGH
ncbi:hypothetical protein [Hydrogenophaga sp.]|uniref:hypothetical protein n=1 Tax=Hydrogenophaga sp. TaxID=1904254 RepID=UPI0025BEDE23|nr:hypothetical protein [Hydrogenophaga sp.]MBT9464500.1 hypothetical protein [Hydrogenophaga sp.]